MVRKSDHLFTAEQLKIQDNLTFCRCFQQTFADVFLTFSRRKLGFPLNISKFPAKSLFPAI